MDTETHANPGCDFRHRRFHTVVTSEKELHLFRRTLDDLLANRSAASWLTPLFRISTLHDVLALSNASVGATPTATEAFVQDRFFALFKPHGKNWLQSMKKLHGCLAYATGPRSACFLVDSESRVRHRSVCQAVSYYLAKKSVVVVPVPLISKASTEKPIGGPMLGSVQAITARNSLKLLRDDVRGRLAAAEPPLNSFFAMSVYHWVFEPHEVSEFLRDGLRAPLATLASFPDLVYVRPFVEEAFYHFAATRRASWGHTFVNLLDEATPALTEWARPCAAGCTGGAAQFVMENGFHMLKGARDVVADDLADFFRRHQLPVSRCPNEPHPSAAFQRFERVLDLCVSSYNLIPGESAKLHKVSVH